MDYFSSNEHFELHALLSKLVGLEKISVDEMESLLIKSGLTKIDENTYKDDSGSILSFSL